MESARRSRNTTKHGLISNVLCGEIRDGQYCVGDYLPSEPELSERFQVSRHTVRAALRTLHALGLVTSQQGVGTRVKERQPDTGYTCELGSAVDLIQYATSTRVGHLKTTEIVTDAARASWFGCAEGEKWWRLQTLRFQANRAVVAYSEIYIPLAFGTVLEEARRSGQPVFTLIERELGERVQEIRQEISCVATLTDEERRHLKVASGLPALQIVRRYIGTGGRTLELTRSLHPSDIFKYSMKVELRRGSQGGST